MNNGLIPTWLDEALEKEIFSFLDYSLAKLLIQDENSHNPSLLFMLILWLSRESRRGNVCVQLTHFSAESLFLLSDSEYISRAWQSLNTPTIRDCQQVLMSASCVSDGHNVTPLVLEHDRLYLQRLWQNEKEVARFISERAALTPAIFSSQLISAILNQLFLPQEETDWQKIAAAIAITRSFSVISGGPGTGKTTTVAKLIAALVKLNSRVTHKKLRIILAAPTGKAAARLSEALNHTINSLILTDEERAQFPSQSYTLHRLLGANLNRRTFQHSLFNPLHADVLIIDEASMIDLPMMNRLMNALSPTTRLILLGDGDQLSSVEAGAVLGDLCDFMQANYSPAHCEELFALTGYAIKPGSTYSKISDSICLLQKSYRFKADSGIAALAQAVNRQDSNLTSYLLEQPYQDISYHPLKSVEEYAEMITYCVDHYQHYLQLLSTKTPQQILMDRNQFQLLCTVRKGNFGVIGLNEQIERQLLKRKLIQKNGNSNWYVGRPVMIRQNDYELGIYNGDIGITLFDSQLQKLVVCFLLPNKMVKMISPNRLPEHDTAFAMTVHQSQGSEFSEVVFVLPDQYIPLLTKELIYTSITRAKQKLTLFADKLVLKQAIITKIRRNSGLVRTLISLSVD